MPSRRHILALCLVLCAAPAFGQATRPTTLPNAIAIPRAPYDRAAYFPADGPPVWFVPAEGGNVTNRPAVGLKIDRGDRWADWKLAGPAPSTQPTPPPSADPNGVYVAAGASWVDAVKAAKPGQSVYLPAGELREGLTSKEKVTPLTGVRIIGHKNGTTIRVPSGHALFMWCWTDVLVSGLRVRCDDTTDRGFIFRGCHNLTVEDCDVDGFVFGMVFESAEAGGRRRDSRNVTVRRCRVTNNRPTDKEVRSSGIYASDVAGLVIEDCLIDANGWNARFPGSSENQNVYLTGTCSDTVVRRNVIARAAGHGLQARAGGLVEDNLFLNNPVHLTYGQVYGSGPIKLGGVTGGVRRNVFDGTRPIAGTPRGWAIEVGDNVLSADVTGNTINLDGPFTPGRGQDVAAIKVDVGKLDDGVTKGEKPNPHLGRQIGVRSLVIDGNAVTYPPGLPAYWINPELKRAKVATRTAEARPAALVTVQPAFPPADPAVVGAARARLTR